MRKNFEAKRINSSKDLALSDIEESFVRMHKGIGVLPEELLAKKTNNKALLKRLLDLEQEIMQRAQDANSLLRSR